jgi:hypothetical protein
MGTAHSDISVIRVGKYKTLVKSLFTAKTKTVYKFAPAINAYH